MIIAQPVVDITRMEKEIQKTVMGEVGYSRVSYEYTDEQGRNARVFLLDKALGQAACGKISNLLAEKIAETNCENSFRKTSEAISSMTGQAISHTGAWNVVQSLGETVNLQEEENTKDIQMQEFN